MMTTALLFAVLTTTAEIETALMGNRVGEPFALEATALSDCQAQLRDFGVADASGVVIVSADRKLTNVTMRAGTRIRACGQIKLSEFNHACAEISSLEEIGYRPVPQPETATFDQILAGRFDARTVRTSGVLRDYFSDEIDPKYVFLILNQHGKTLYAACRQTSPDDFTRLDALIGSEITVTGLCDPRPSGCRRKIGRILQFATPKDVRSPARFGESPFAAPLLDMRDPCQPAELVRLGRHRARGTVTAVWQGTSFLIRTQEGGIARVNLAKGLPPQTGTYVEIVGFPETDLYRINFSRASWRTADSTAEPSDPPADISARDIMTNFEGNQAFNANFHGRAVRLRGTVRSLPSIGNDGRFYLECDGYTIPIDISANPAMAERLEIGSVIDVTGVCVMDIENWRPNLVFPHIKEVMIVTRTPTDIVIVRRPPWWTPARLTVVIGSLLLVLVGILAWNRALKALAEKRGRALANKELERLEADLKVCERTRLAVELHDSLAQNLTGVSMEIDSALRCDAPLPPDAAQHMGRALRTIDSCRGELRNCLWDLRNQALEEEDMNKAIRLTLSQTIGTADLTVRFNVPRARFSDNTAHALLRIIRELASNAVRHGHATEIGIAGSLENGVLKFSVRDNGCGFDPDTCPGVLDGHFGLQGVRERVASFEGDVEIESTIGRGTHVSVAISALQTEDEENS